MHEDTKETKVQWPKIIIVTWMDSIWCFSQAVMWWTKPHFTLNSLQNMNWPIINLQF